MVVTVEQIRELKEYYVNDLYKDVRKEQKTDDEYITDSFNITEVKSPHTVLRSGLGYIMVNSPAEQIVTSNPQAFLDILKGKAEAGNRISKLLNEKWIPILRKQNPQPFKETVKNKLGRGESYIKVLHNSSWVTGKKPKIGLPIFFVILDPMVIYGSPEEDENGIPNKVIVFYERQYQDLIVKYPNWTNPKNRKEKEKIEWLEYWDSSNRYFEADGEATLDGGIQPNIYGFVPFVRKYSGFGRRSPDGNLKYLIMSDIRYSRDLIKEECIMRSDISSTLHISAHKPKLVTSTGKINEEMMGTLSFGTYDINVLDNLPPDFKMEDLEVAQPEPEAYQHLRDIKAEIIQRNPFVMAGFPWGQSGRQQDLTATAAMARYDTVIENTENEWATAFEMAFRIIQAIPDFDIDGLNKGDLDAELKYIVKLRAADPVEEDRKATLGDRLWNMGNGSIDIGTFHTQYLGYTKEDSEKIKAKMLVDKLTLYNPDVAAVMGMVFAEESGMDKWLEMARQKRAQMEQQQAGLQQAPPATTTERVQGETQTPLGQEMTDMALSSRGARRPPVRYKRGA